MDIRFAVNGNSGFPPEVRKKLRCYVYRLIDPRNGETFYVGKGTGDRVFQHSRAEPGIEGNDLDNKMARIREIRPAGLEVIPVIHRHGMDEATSLAVEAALIDAYPRLTNGVRGVGARNFGPMHVQEIIQMYGAEEATFRHRAILISVDHGVLDQPSVYEAVRYAWRIDPEKAQQAEVVLATVQGIIKGAFVAEKWLEATSTNFPGRSDAPGRYGFVGAEAPKEICQHYIDKRVPQAFRARGAANPIRYTY